MQHITHIHNEFGQHLRNFIHSRVKNEDDVSDIYQNIILKIITKIDTVKNSESLKSWIFTIANNQIMDFYRKNKPLVNVETVESQLPIPLHENESTAYPEMEGCIYSLISQLPDEYKLVIEESEIKGVSQKELAATLGLNYVTLRSKVQRGRERLKKMLNDSCLIEQAALGTVMECLPKNSSDSCGKSSSCT